MLSYYSLVAESCSETAAPHEYRKMEQYVNLPVSRTHSHKMHEARKSRLVLQFFSVRMPAGLAFLLAIKFIISFTNLW